MTRPQGDGDGWWTTSPRPEWSNEPTQKIAPIAPPYVAGNQAPPAPVVPVQVAPEPAAPPAAAAAKRESWADVAKGVCILLVVMWHVIMKHYLQITWHLPVPLPGVWGTFGDQLLPLRMPVFFTISGMFAANAARRSWKVTARSRIAKFYYLYVLWFTVHTAVLSLVPNFDTLAARNVGDLIEQLTITPTNLWYLVALAVYFVIAKLTLKLPVAVVLVPAFALSAIASAGLLAAPGNRGQMYQNLIFFLAGLRLKPLVERWARTATLRMLLIGGGGYLVVMLVLGKIGAKEWFGVWPVVSALAVVVGIAAAAQLQRWAAVGGLLSRLGQNTLPIYVMHMPLLALWHLALLKPFSAAGTGVQFVLALFLPLVLTALLATACLTLRRGLEAVGAHWLFDLPSRKKKPAAPAPPGAPADAEKTATIPAWGDNQATIILPYVR